MPRYGDHACDRSRVGGATEVEVKERKNRMDDAMHATRAAVEEGIMPGAGVALLRASQHLKGLRTKNDDQKTDVEIVRKAFSYPACQIAINAGRKRPDAANKSIDMNNLRPHGISPLQR
jgi:chaperonin GroEL (HSP60 family)